MKEIKIINMEIVIKLVPTLVPTFDQWKSLPIYLTRHETSLQRRFGAVKIVPPSRWIPLTRNPSELFRIKIYNEQNIDPSSDHTGVFYLNNINKEKRRFMPYMEFKTLAESDMYRLPNDVPDDIDPYFWSTLTANAPLYVTDIDATLFAKREDIFNMASLTSLLMYYPKKIPGLTSPSIDLGMWSRVTGIHVDDNNLTSLYYLHWGAPKIWYIIHPLFCSKFEQLVNELNLLPDISCSCSIPLQHRTLIVNPSFLEKYSIQFYQIEQKVNELVVIFPGIYHFYYDTGFNVSESIKYALPSWLQTAQPTRRHGSCLIPSINIARQFFTTDLVDKFREQYMTASNENVCIDILSDDDDIDTMSSMPTPVSLCDNVNVMQGITTKTSTVETEVVQETTYTDLLLDEFLEPFNISPSNHSISNDMLSTFINPNNQEEEQQAILNLFKQISTQMKTKFQTNSNSKQSSRSIRLHSHCHTSSKSHYKKSSHHTHSSYTIISNRKRNTNRRRCYRCRQRGHVEKECPNNSRP